jgi:hypothetical protein
MYIRTCEILEFYNSRKKTYKLSNEITTGFGEGVYTRDPFLLFVLYFLLYYRYIDLDLYFISFYIQSTSITSKFLTRVCNALKLPM